MQGNNYKLNFEQYGENSPRKIVILHGWGHSIDVIRPLAKLLQDQGEVYVLDLPGHGKSPLPPAPWGITDFAMAVAGFIKEENLAPVILLGHSVGGKTSIKLTSLYPELVDKLILINSSGLKRKRTFKQQLRIFFIQKTGKILKFLKNTLNLPYYENWFVKKFASADYKNAGPLKDTLVKIVNEDVDEDLKKIKKQTLLLWSENDTETPVSSGEKMKQLLINSRLVIMKAVGHVPWVEAAASNCVYYIKNFIAENTDGK